MFLFCLCFCAGAWRTQGKSVTISATVVLDDGTGIECLAPQHECRSRRLCGTGVLIKGNPEHSFAAATTDWALMGGYWVFHEIKMGGYIQTNLGNSTSENQLCRFLYAAGLLRTFSLCVCTVTRGG